MKVLYIGDMENVLDSVQAKRSVIRAMQSVDDFKEIYNEFKGIRFTVPLVLYDLSLLYFRQSYLLKFIEDFPTHLLCLASYDNILSTVLSRFNKVIKNVHIPEILERDPAQLDEIFMSETHYINEFQTRKLIANHAPTFMPFYLSTKKAKSQRKLLQAKIGVM